jgi:shikimate dehydrogenase
MLTMAPDEPGRCGVVGSPIGHSLSPVLHRAAYAALGLPWTYDPFEIGRGQLRAFVASDPGRALRGLSVTMPLKHEALALAAERGQVADTARLVGAANTLVRQDPAKPVVPGQPIVPVQPGEPARFLADNTDVPGAMAALTAAGVGADADGLAGAEVVVVGAGGTAQAMVLALGRLGATAVRVLARRPDAARDALTPVAAAAGVELTVQMLAADAFGRPDLVVSALPRGALDPFADAAGVAGAVFDVLYDPWPTPLAAAGARQGAVVVGGLDLLVHQAARQVELMTGCASAPVQAMAAAGERALAARTSK